jgi:hypothetical protein
MAVKRDERIVLQKDELPAGYKMGECCYTCKYSETDYEWVILCDLHANREGAWCGIDVSPGGLCEHYEVEEVM